MKSRWNGIPRTHHLLGLLAGGFCWVASFAVFAAEPPHVEIQQLQERAFDHLYNLEYDRAIERFRQIADHRPRHPQAYNLLAYSYLLRETQRRGGLARSVCSATRHLIQVPPPQPDPIFAEDFHGALRHSFSVAKQELRVNPDDIDAAYRLGVAHLLSAFYSFQIRKKIFGGLHHARKAERYCRRSVRLDPYFYDAYLVTGLYDYALGSLPSLAKFFLFFRGARGNKRAGLVEIRAAASYGTRTNTAARIVLAILLGREKQWDDVQKLLKGLERQYPRNYYFPLLSAAVAEKQDHIQEALDIYESFLVRGTSSGTGSSGVIGGRVHYQTAALYMKDDRKEESLAHLNEILHAPDATKELRKLAEKLRKQILDSRPVSAAAGS